MALFGFRDGLVTLRIWRADRAGRDRHRRDHPERPRRSGLDREGACAHASGWRRLAGCRPRRLPPRLGHARRHPALDRRPRAGAGGAPAAAATLAASRSRRSRRTTPCWRSPACVPESSLLGPNITRLPEAAARRGEVALTFDDGPHPEITPRVLDLLDRFGATASFFCIGGPREPLPRAYTRNPGAGPQPREPHADPSARLCPAAADRDRARNRGMPSRTLRRVAEAEPRFFRAPAGIRSPLLDPALAIRRLALCQLEPAEFRLGWTAGRTGCSGGCCAACGPGDILVLHDGSPVRTDAGVPVILAVLPALLRALRERGLRAVSLPARSAE